MKYPKLSRLLKRRQVEISTERGYIVSQKQLAEEASTPEYPISQRSMGHWFNGGAMPESWYWPGLNRVFGPGFYIAVGHPELEQMEPTEIDPRLQWLIANQDNPGVRRVLEQIEEQGETILRNPDKPVRIVTFAPS